ncbi:glycosyltransferase family 4 protein [Billgrantia pellis]|uniref:Glycosyltransferase family 4 protein n=1 Tax=Billgrantia pellis TaxID=2606936 RepID=A0A7V7KIG0_9GAMM|nr:glycosyltransferase family 4 protein [Halomonas pellis]KAA0012908.1 glycosyltransferase family 4 protein [Halomonas pellis]
MSLNTKHTDAFPPLKHLLVVTPHFDPESFRINEVVASLARDGLTITVLTGQPNYPEGRVYSGYRIWRAGWDTPLRGADIARVPVITRGSGGILRRLFSYLSFIVSAVLIGTLLLRRRDFDAILYYGVSPIFLAVVGLWFRWLKKAPMALWVQDLWPGSLDAAGFRIGSGLRRLLSGLTGWLYCHCDRILVASEGFPEEIRQFAGRNLSCVFHPNPAEAAVFETPSTASTESSPFEVLFAGNLGRALGLPTLLDAAQRLANQPDIRFRVVGGGSRSAWLAEEVRRLGLNNVILQGRVPPSAMPLLYANASALLISLSRSPTMSRSLPSKTGTCLATGKPLLVSADGETARVVADAGAGLCAPAGDGAALAEAMRRLHALPADTRAAMGRAGRAYCERHFAPDLLADRLHEHLRSMLTPPERART